MIQVFKDIPGYEGLYRIDNDGNVLSLPKIGSERYNIVTQLQNEKGYMYVCLRKNGQHKERIHRLVAKTFLEPVEGKNEVNHKDGNKINNNYKNLEWCTHLENMQHAWDTGLKVRKLTAQKVADIRQDYSNGGVSKAYLARKYNISPATVGEVINGVSWKSV